jgi:hypothetical protein
VRLQGRTDEPLELRIRRIIMRKYHDAELMASQDLDRETLMAFPNEDVNLRFHFDDGELHFALGPAKVMDWMSDEALEKHIWKDQTTR